jgi:hypothetical protein
MLRGALTGPAEPRLWDLLAVAAVLTTRDTLPEASDSATSVGDDGASQYLHRLRDPNPRGWRVTEARPAGTDAEALAQLASPEFDPHRTVLLAATASPEPTPTNAPSSRSGPGGGARLLSHGAGEIRASTAGAEPAWLVFAELDYPGWRATVDGAPADIVRADVALIAVAVPAGEHEVQLTFRAPIVTTGAIVSLLSLALLAALTAAHVRGRDRSRIS